MAPNFCLAPIFADGALLQRDLPLRIFGSGPEDAEVTVRLAGHTAATRVYRQRWCVELPPLAAAEGLTLTAECQGLRLTIRDLVLGEVWVAGGQSNMEFWLRNEAERDTVIPAAKDPLLRFFDMPRLSYPGQEKDLPMGEYGIWRTFTPPHAGWFSAVGAYFGLALRRALGVPVAVVGCNCGATSASCWLNKSSLEAVPALSPYLERYKQTLAGLDLKQYTRDFKARQRFGLTSAMQEFDTHMARGDLGPGELQTLLEEKLGPLTPYQRSLFLLPVGPLSAQRPFALYHSMVQRLAPFTARGVIWYQGESDADHPDLYARLFGQMVRCWRDAWGQQLPFLTVQLAPFDRWLDCTGEHFPLLRAQQQSAADSLPGVWLTSIMDSGMENDIHPKHKRPVGERLALLALGKVYGRELLCQGPHFRGVRPQKGGLTLFFENAGTGLYTKAGFPSELEVLVDNAPTACSIQVHGNTVTLWSPPLGNAKQVRIHYAWRPYAKAALYNSAGLCAFPFQTHWNNLAPE